MKKLTLIALGLTCLQSAFAVPTVTSWKNPECDSGSCEVKGLKIFLEKMTTKTFMGNVATVEIEGSHVSVLPKYGIVQYIKGCVYDITDSGKVKMATRTILGKQSQPFLHRDWEVDSADDSDPVFWSNDQAGYDSLRGFEIPRNSGYAYANPALTDKYGPWGGKPKNLPAAKIYVNDMPTPSQWSINSDLTQVVRTTSLNFKACVYDMSKVPRNIEDPKVMFDDAIGCLDWNSNFSYDFKKRKFVEQKEISTVCQ